MSLDSLLTILSAINTNSNISLKTGPSQRLVAQSCPTLFDPMDCSTPGFAVFHYLLELGKLMSIGLYGHLLEYKEKSPEEHSIHGNHIQMSQNLENPLDPFRG